MLKLQYKNSCVKFDAIQGEMVYVFPKNMALRSENAKIFLADHNLTCDIIVIIIYQQCIMISQSNYKQKIKLLITVVITVYMTSLMADG